MNVNNYVSKELNHFYCETKNKNKTNKIEIRL